MASMAGQIGLDGGAAYGATKAAHSSMTRSWAAGFSPRGVRVDAIAAGPVFSAPEKGPLIEQLGKTTLLGRGAQVHEITEVVAFLASEKANYLTGATPAADGGRTADRHDAGIAPAARHAVQAVLEAALSLRPQPSKRRMTRLT